MRKIVLDMTVVLALYNLPLSTVEVGRRLGCSGATIDRALRRAGALRERKRISSLNGKWTGGRYRMKNGYIAVNVGPGQYEYEHRVVMAKLLGRSLEAGEVVHHRNGDKADNDPGNLCLESSNAEHIRKHHGSAGETAPS